MGQELDSLEVKIEATATKAINSVNKLINQLTRLSTSLASVNGSSLTGLSNSVTQLNNAMQNMNVKTTDFTRLAKNITKIGSVDSVSLNNTSVALTAVAKSVSNLSAIPDNATQVTEFAKSLGKLGSKSIENATVNIPKLGNALNGLMTTLSRAPTVNQNVISMTNALANLASQGSKVGSSSTSLQKSLYGTSNSLKGTSKSSWSLAQAFGKLYANYFLIIRGTKQLWKSIETSMDYVETLNYFNAAFGQVADNAVKTWKTSGYDSAEAYYNSFAKRAEQLTQKMSGYAVSDSGMLTATGQKSLGIDPEQLMNYQAVFGQMSSSMGTTSENALILSNVLSEIGADLASVKNLDFNKVWNDMSSGLAGMSRTLDKYGVNIRNVNLQQELTNLGIEANITNLNQNEKALLRTIILLNSTKYAWGDLSRTLDQPANQLRLLQANFSNLGRTIGNIFLPMVAKVLPYLNALTIVAQRAAQAIVNFLGFGDFDWGGLGGMSSNDALSDIYDEVGDVSDGLADATGNAKELKNTLMGFDEINKLSDTTDSSKSSASGSGLSAADTAKLDEAFKKMASEYQVAWDKAFAGVSNRAQELADILEQKFEPVKKIFQDFAIDDFKMAGKDTSELVAGILNWFADAIDKVPWFTIGQKMGDYLAGIEWTKVFKAAGRVIVQGLKGAIELYLGMFSKVPIETALISLIAIPKLMKAIGGSSVIASITKGYKTLNTLSITAEDTAKAMIAAKNGNTAAASALTFLHPKIAKTTVAFQDFRKAVATKGLFTTLNSGITKVRSNMTLFQKALLGGVSAFGEFKLIESGFADITAGSENLVLSIGKIAGGAAIGAAGLYTAFGPAGLAMAAITAVIGGIAGIVKGFDNLSEKIPDYTKGYATVRDEVGKTTAEIQQSISDIEKSWQSNTTTDEIEALKNKYFELATQTNLTTEQQKLLKDIAGELIQKVPELSDVIDTETGAYKGTREEIEKLIEKKEEEYRLEALRENYIELIKQEYEGKKNLKKMEDTLNDSKEKLRQKQEELNKLTYNGALQVVEMTPDEATAYASVTREIEQLNKEVKANQDKVNEARGTVQQATDDMQFCWNELKNTAVGTSQETQQAVANAYEQAKNEVQSKLGIIDSDTNNTFSKFGNIGANAGSDLSRNFSNNISNIPYAAQRTYQNIIDRVNAGGIGEETGTELMNALARTIDSNAWRIKNSLSSSFASNFSGDVFDNEGNLSSGAFHIKITPKAYAVGGFPEDGLFYANHNEMVGKFSNGRTAVANNEQITEGIKQAVVEGMAEVFANANFGQQNGNVIVQIDGQEVFRTTQRYANQYTAMTGQPAFNY